MLKSVGLFGRKKSTRRPFKDYYTGWFNTLKNTLLPQLRRCISSPTSSSAILFTHVEMLHHHFQAYYEALDLAASDDVSRLLFPDWRNSLEMPFLWLGDLHPYLFTNLLRAFLDGGDGEEEEEEEEEEEGSARESRSRESRESFDRPWHVVMAWRSPSKTLTAQIDQIECGLRLMVPALAARFRDAQATLVERVGEQWGKKEGMKTAVREAIAAEMNEMTTVFLNANRLRRSVLAEILSAATVHQGALFLEGLAQFLVGFRDHDLIGEFERCKTPIN